MIKLLRFALQLCLFALMLTSTAPLAAAVVPEGIPIGPADENAETSRAVTAILDNCVAAFEAVDALHATGHYIEVSKDEDIPTSYSEARVTVDYKSPGKLGIHVHSNSPTLACALVADGSTVTMVWAHQTISGFEKKYLKLPQPDSLAAISDTHRAGGELIADQTGALSIASITSLLITEDVHTILFANIDRFIYEGSDKVGDRKCHRIRFIQSNPDVNVILWIDSQDFLLRKTSFIYSYNENYELVDSFEEGTRADMKVMQWDNITTDPAKFDEAALKAKIPHGYEPAKPKEREASEDKGKSLWESLVTEAAATSDETSWTLTRLQGNLDFTAEKFIRLPGKEVEIHDVLLPGISKNLMGVATSNGKITYYDYSGSAQSSVSLHQKIDKIDWMQTTSGQAMQIITVPPDSKKLTAWSLEGKRLWTYSHPECNVSALKAGVKEDSVYIALDYGGGVRKLDSHGNIEFALGSTYGNSLYPAPPGIDRVLYSSFGSYSVLDKELHNLGTVSTIPDSQNTAIKSIAIEWDTENKDAPVISLASTFSKDVLLQRRTTSGEVKWTTTIQPELEKLKGFGVVWVTLPIDGKPQRCIFTALSTGQIVLTDKNGKVMYRGELDVDPATVKRSGGRKLSKGCTADLNGDGITENYLQVGEYLLRLECATPGK